MASRNSSNLTALQRRRMAKVHMARERLPHTARARLPRTVLNPVARVLTVQFRRGMDSRSKPAMVLHLLQEDTEHRVRCPRDTELRLSRSTVAMAVAMVELTGNSSSSRDTRRIQPLATPDIHPVTTRW